MARETTQFPKKCHIKWHVKSEGYHTLYDIRPGGKRNVKAAVIDYIKD